MKRSDLKVGDTVAYCRGRTYWRFEPVKVQRVGAAGLIRVEHANGYVRDRQLASLLPLAEAQRRQKAAEDAEAARITARDAEIRGRREEREVVNAWLHCRDIAALPPEVFHIDGTVTIPVALLKRILGVGE